MMNNTQKVTFKEWKDNIKANFSNVRKRQVMTQNILMFFGKLFRTLILIGLSFVIVLPIFEKVSAAVRHFSDITNPNVIWIPETYSWFNINFAIELLDYEHTIFNTLFISIGCTLLQIFSTSLAGYAFARLKFKGRDILFYLTLLTLVVPNEALDRSRTLFLGAYSFFGVKLIGNIFSMFILSLFGQGIRSAIFVFLFRQFFKGVPIELEESAQVDGAGVIRTFWSVMLPNARGAIVTVSLFSFVWQWNDYYFGQLLNYTEDTMPLLGVKLGAGSEKIKTIIGTWIAEGREAIKGISVEDSSDPLFVSLVTNTGALLMMLPLLIGYFFVQKQFVESIERTGITG